MFTHDIPVLRFYATLMFS